MKKLIVNDIHILWSIYSVFEGTAELHFTDIFKRVTNKSILKNKDYRLKKKVILILRKESRKKNPMIIKSKKSGFYRIKSLTNYQLPSLNENYTKGIQPIKIGFESDLNFMKKAEVNTPHINIGIFVGRAFFYIQSHKNIIEEEMKPLNYCIHMIW